ncbi:MAG: glycosyltransferase family 4 protein [Thermodesulfobacteriota bacterium]|nr:MAG: glycosyltransferase family 4 protein [Thermodesulfobacteriota bacterium]
MQNTKSKINLLILNSSLHYGGSETVIANLCRHLDRGLFNVSASFLKFKGKVGEELECDGYEVIGPTAPKRSISRYMTFYDLLRTIRRKKVDIVHSHCTHSLMDSSICRLLCPGIKTAHTFHFGNYPFYNKKYMRFEKFFSRGTDSLVAVADFQRERLREAYGIQDARIRTIWNGVAPVPPGRIDIPFPPGSLIIGSIGNLIEQKGYIELLQVALCLKKAGARAKFVVIGGGPMHESLIAERGRLQLADTVHFQGYLENAASRALPSFDIFFMPSRWEAMPVALLEAMCAGKPIVATDVSDNPRIIEHGRTGLLVKKGAPLEMQSALERLIGEPALRQKMGAEARKDYERRFTVSRMIRSYEELYMSLMDSRGSARARG